MCTLMGSLKKYSNCVHSRRETVYVPKKIVFIQLGFKGDTLSAQTGNRLKAAIKRTYCAAKLAFSVTTKKLLRQSSVHMKSILVISNCVYLFYIYMREQVHEMG